MNGANINCCVTAAQNRFKTSLGVGGGSGRRFFFSFFFSLSVKMVPLTHFNPRKMCRRAADVEAAQ